VPGGVRDGVLCKYGSYDVVVKVDVVLLESGTPDFYIGSGPPLIVDLKLGGVSFEIIGKVVVS